MVEILIVIVVIGILAMLLFPVFARVRSAARTTVCASNLRQIGQALRLYTGDNNRFYPLRDPGIDNPDCCWAQPLYGYVKDTNVFWCPSFPHGEFRLGCPASDFSQGVGYGEAYLWDGSYDMPDLFQIQRPGSRMFNEVQLQRPSGTVIFCDGTGSTRMRDIRGISHIIIDGESITEEELLDFSYLGNRHNGGANNCFADGHVKWLSFDAMRNPSLWRPDEPTQTTNSNSSF